MQKRVAVLSPRIMNVLAALVILIVAAGVTLAEQAKCQHLIHCPCGSTNKNVTVCTQKRRKDNICNRWSECKTCQDGLDRCLECPKGLKGPLCKTATRRKRLYRQRRQFSYRPSYNVRPRRPNIPYQQGPANSYPTVSGQRGGDFCPEINSPKGGSIRCLTSERQRTCVGTCVPGYSFESRGSENEITLTCTGDYFTPLREFPPCRSGGYCDLVVQGAGSFNCTTGMTGTRCDVICDGRHVGRYSCYPGRDWDPHLPYCIRPKVVEEGHDCHCEYGGTCDHYGHCVCPVGRTGTFCESIVPETQICNDPGFVTNGFRRNLDDSDSSIYRMFDEGETVVFDCVSEEYALQGSSILTCKSDGTWSKPLPKCVKTIVTPDSSLIFCQDPGVDPNGSRNPRLPPSPRGFPQGSSLEYSCKQGFDLDGEKRLFCLASGQWLSTRPKCNAISRQPASAVPSLTYCPDPGVDPNGSRNPRSPPNRQRFPQGTMLQYSCNRGYDLDGDRNIFCLITGEWSSGRPKCNSQSREPGPDTIAFCRDPGVDPNGSRNPPSPPNQQGFPQGTSLEYSCNPGYVLDGERSMFCLASGQWLSATPTCRAQSTANVRLAYCLNPGAILNGRVVYHPPINNRRKEGAETDLDDPEFPQGGRLEYTCDSGYILEGSSSQTCQADENWSAAKPDCRRGMDRRRFCNHPGSVVNGRVVYIPAPNERNRPSDFNTRVSASYPQGSRLQYSCDNGYSLDKPSSLTCEASGRWSSDPPKCITICGRSAMGTTRRILHGNKTAAGEWPWVVAIAAVRPNGDTGPVICGGAVINSRTVITAAHCLQQGRQYTLYFGKYNLSSSLDDSKVLNRSVRRENLIIHEDFENETLDSDIGLIRFEPEITFSDRIRPICLPTGESTAVNVEPGMEGFVNGWGNTERKLPSRQLLMARLPVVSDETCRQSYRQNMPNFHLVLTQNMFCAGYEDTRQSTCIGDSGSPIVFYDKVLERYTLEGLVSFGVEGECGQHGTYSIFTKVSRFHPWIIRNMAK